MNVEYLKLRNFRNYDKCLIEFKPHVNILLGNNAQGKTNILEAIVYLSTVRSPRVSSDQQMIKEGTEMSSIEANYEDETKKEIKAVIHQKGKTLFYQKQLCQKSSDFIGKLNVILFSPDDLSLFNDSPRERRKFIDIENTKVSKSYIELLNQYNKFLKERNIYLKNIKVDDDYLNVLDEKMIELQINILKQRKVFIDFINSLLTKYYEKLTNTKDQISCEYESCVDISSDEQIKKDLKQMYVSNKEKDLLFKMTNAGIHRDDLIFKMNNKRVEQVASQGQKRSIVIALKLSLIDFIENKTKKKPVLLLDDVLSELDIDKQNQLIKLLPNDLQTIITTTSINDCIKEIIDQCYVQVIEKGSVKEYKEETNE